MPDPPGGGGGGTNIPIQYCPPYTGPSNHLALPFISNNVVFLTIVNGGGAPYDLFSIGNLKTLDQGAIWTKILRTTSGQTVIPLYLTNLPSPNCWFMLGGTNDYGNDGIADAYQWLTGNPDHYTNQVPFSITITEPSSLSILP